ncbi:MAG: penicillin-binding protein 2 [Candidatus Pacebacteria bacterium]|jgi:penicillin-binding protein 2|nr:penicillin-binding protein 2 [Candidatus Paceibacterota bacterium]
MFRFLHFGKNSGRIVLDRRADIEPHEIFYDRLAKSHEEESNIGEKKIEISISERSLRLPFVAACLFFALAVLRVATIQAFDGREYAAQAAQNKYLFHRVQSDRGIIYDVNFKPLVENLSTFDLVCDGVRMPKAAAERRLLIGGLSAVTGVDAFDLARSIEAGKTPLIESLEHQALIVLEARIADFPGCQISKRAIRNYAKDAGLAQLLGYMGKIEPDEWKPAADVYSINDYVGRAGLEKTYENVLRKDPGKLRIERDAKGNIISQDVAVSPESGDSVQLWLDLDLQKKLYGSMKAQLANLGLKRGAAIAMDPKTGGVLAMVSFPDYDNNAFSQGDQERVQALLNDKDTPLLNRAVSGRYLTGSTIKPLEAAAALQEKIIIAEKNINCVGKLVVQNRYNPEIVYTYNDNHVHGPTNMYKAIAESCNAYFQTIGGGYGNQQGLGPTRIKKYLDLFGWEEQTGIDLPGEINGFVPDQAWKKEKFAGTQDSAWGDGDTYNLAIGQGFIGITPIEVANAYAAIANGGTLYKPQMVKNVVDGSRQVVEEKKPSATRENFIDAQNLLAVREGMRHGVNGAGAPLASSLILNQLGIPMGAKTGTAQLRKGSDGKDLMNSWVTVFAPYDEPKIVLLVMMEEVHEGQLAVLPVAKDVLGWYFTPQEVRDLLQGATTTNESGTTTNAALPEVTTTPERIEERLQRIQDQVEQLRHGDVPPATDPEAQIGQ